MKPFTCPECGGMVRPIKRRGRMARHSTMMIEVPETIRIPECDRCGERFIDARTAKVIDAALAKVYRAALHQLVRRAIEVLTKHVEQKDLEQLLGLSHGYLSHLKAGRKMPSPELVAHLGVLAKSPAKRVGELRAYWHENEPSRRTRAA